MSALLIAAIVGGAVLAVIPPRRTGLPTSSSEQSAKTTQVAPHGRGLVSVGASVLVALAVVALVGGVIGVVGGALVGVASALALRRLEQRQDADERQRFAGQVPVACDLMSALLSSGATPHATTEAVAQALGPPIAKTLNDVAARLRLGADPAAAWAPLAAHTVGAPVAAAAVRAADSGAPLADTLRRVAVDLRRERRTALLTRARVLGVRVVLPLGVCFLPAFLLVGVVPVVVTLIGQVATGVTR